jgi:large subunit ribosomal protein L7/L12
MTLLEIKELVDGLKEAFGVDPSAMSVGSGSAQAAVEVVEEKTEFDVIIKNFGANKISVIKVVREITGLGLGEAKTLTETPNGVIKEKAKKEDAAAIAEKLKAAGAEVEVK